MEELEKFRKEVGQRPATMAIYEEQRDEIWDLRALLDSVMSELRRIRARLDRIERLFNYEALDDGEELPSSNDWEWSTYA